MRPESCEPARVITRCPSGIHGAPGGDKLYSACSGELHGEPFGAGVPAAGPSDAMSSTLLCASSLGPSEWYVKPRKRIGLPDMPLFAESAKPERPMVTTLESAYGSKLSGCEIARASPGPAPSSGSSLGPSIAGTGGADCVSEGGPSSSSRSAPGVTAKPGTAMLREDLRGMPVWPLARVLELPPACDKLKERSPERWRCRDSAYRSELLAATRRRSGVCGLAVPSGECGG